MGEQARVLVGRYALRRELGRGAMGVVWLARDELLDRDVAVKQLLLPTGLSETAAEQASARAMREARLAARLHHPNAVSVFDVVTEQGRPWLVMEYLPSRSLAERLADGPLSPAEAARVGAPVAAALAVAHQLGIVHRDVKPANVLVADDGTVKITDFGIARAADDVKVTETGLVAGTPAFLAPEVARGSQPDPAADVFSLGATLYAAIEGEPPFGLEENNLALLNRVAAGQYRPARRAGRLAVVLDAMLSAAPSDRLTAGESAQLLGEAAELLAADAQRAEPLSQQATASLDGPASGGTADRPSPTLAATSPPTTLMPDLLPPTLLDSTAFGSPALGTPALASSALGSSALDSVAQGSPPRTPAKRRWDVPAAIAAGLVILTAIAGITLAGGDGDEDRSGGERVAGAPYDASEVVEFVDDYFDELPDDTEAAYESLAPDRRPGYDQFADAWRDYDDIELAGRPQVAGSGSSFTVDVRLEVERDGSDETSVETLRMRVVESQGRLVIADGAVLDG